MAAKPVILLIDDEKLVLESLLNQLKRAFGFQYKYETATEIEEAWEILDETARAGVEIKLIISDWLMPKQKGDLFLIEVYKRYPAIVQVMLSGYADEASIENARKYAHLKAYVSKPWDEEELIQTLTQLLAFT